MKSSLTASPSRVERKLCALLYFIAIGFSAAFCADDETVLPGKRADGMVQLPNQWLLWPVGTQVDLADGAVNSAVHPGGKFLAVQHAGYGPHEIIVVDILKKEAVSTTKVPETFYGVQFSADGKKLFCGAASGEAINVYDFEDGVLKNHEKIQLHDLKFRGIPAGLAVQRDTALLYAANVWGQRISRVELTGEKKVSEIKLAGDTGAILNPTEKLPEGLDEASIAKRDAALADVMPGGAPFPFSCVLDEKRERLYVSLWAKAAVAVIDLKKNEEIARWKTEDHPCEMLLSNDGKTLYVANSNRNSVSVIDTEAGRARETIWCAMHPDTPPGSAPMSLALTPDEKILFIANAGENNVAVMDVSEAGKSKAMGFIPAGWYPTSVRVTPDGKTLMIVNGKGLTSKPNPPIPPKTTLQYIGGILKSTVSIIELPEREKFGEQMASWTARAFACTPAKINAARVAKREADNPVPAKVGDPSPIKYCIYIIKENRTYDQVLGDMKQGRGDPKLCIFGQNTTPNHHKLAEEYVLLDNFYVDGEVSADGHEWSCGAYASDFVEKFWPLSYGHGKGTGKYSYPAEANFTAAAPSAYLWDRAAEANVTYRSYGEFTTSPKGEKPGRAKVKALEGHFDDQYHTFDTAYSDLKRADRFLSELKRFENEGEMPRLQIVRLPNDHTAGAKAGEWTPTACVGQNDLALGMVIEAVSKSKFWAQTAIFILEDDAQNGPDHIDAHRSIAFVVSPYTKRKFIDSNMYSTSSMLRTIELILGMKPMSQYDNAALPMFNSFQAKADLAPYEKLGANVDIEARNKKTAWGAKESEEMNFAVEDANDDLLLNEIVWRSVKGEGSPMPAPVRAAFFFGHAGGDDDDDDAEEGGKMAAVVGAGLLVAAGVAILWRRRRRGVVVKMA